MATNAYYQPTSLGTSAIPPSLTINKPPVPVASTKTPPVPNLNAIPGETYAQYSARVGALPGATGSGAGYNLNSDGSVKDALSTTTDPKELLIKKMTDLLTKQPTSSLVNQYNKMSSDKGIPQLESNVNDYGTQINETMGLLNNLKSNIQSRIGDFIVSEPQRARLEASERAPLTTELGTEQAGKTVAQNELSTAKSDIMNILNLQGKDQSQPMTDLKDLISSYNSLEGSSSAKTSSVDLMGSDGKLHKVLINTDTGETIKDLGQTGSSSSASNKPTASETAKANLATDTTATRQYIEDQIKNVSRSDKYLSPQEWAQMKSSWVSGGESASNFDVIFNQYKNPKDTYD